MTARDNHNEYRGRFATDILQQRYAQVHFRDENACNGRQLYVEWSTQTHNESRVETDSTTASGRGVVPLCGCDWPWGQCGAGGRRGLDDSLSRDRRGYAKQRSRGTSAAPVESPPVAAIAGDALPMKCGRFFGCPKPSCRSVSDRLTLPFRPPEPAIARRTGGGIFCCGRKLRICQSVSCGR